MAILGRLGWCWERDCGRPPRLGWARVEAAEEDFSVGPERVGDGVEEELVGAFRFGAGPNTVLPPWSGYLTLTAPISTGVVNPWAPLPFSRTSNSDIRRNRRCSPRPRR